MRKRKREKERKRERLIEGESAQELMNIYEPLTRKGKLFDSYMVQNYSLQFLPTASAYYT